MGPPSALGPPTTVQVSPAAQRPCSRSPAHPAPPPDPDAAPWVHRLVSFSLLSYDAFMCDTGNSSAVTHRGLTIRLQTAPCRLCRSGVNLTWSGVTMALPIRSQ